MLPWTVMISSCSNLHTNVVKHYFIFLNLLQWQIVFFQDLHDELYSNEGRIESLHNTASGLMSTSAASGKTKQQLNEISSQLHELQQAVVRNMSTIEAQLNIQRLPPTPVSLYIYILLSWNSQNYKILFQTCLWNSNMYGQNI